MEPEDKEFIINFGILTILAGISIAIIFSIMTFIFFYGDPLTIVLCCLLVLIKIRVCDTGIEVSFEKFIKKHLKISLTILK